MRLLARVSLRIALILVWTVIWRTHVHWEIYVDARVCGRSLVRQSHVRIQLRVLLALVRCIRHSWRWIITRIAHWWIAWSISARITRIKPSFRLYFAPTQPLTPNTFMTAFNISSLRGRNGSWRIGHIIRRLPSAIVVASFIRFSLSLLSVLEWRSLDFVRIMHRIAIRRNGIIV
jgi:hypothetical protein